MALRVYNTLTRQDEEFVPLGTGKVRLYTCGPTVYDYAHIGNFRTYLWEDLLRRYLQYQGYRVTQAMNLTDVDDKTIANAREAGLTLEDYTRKYIDAFFEDVAALGIEKAEHYPRATAYIPQMAQLIRKLVDKGHVYESRGSLYFKISTFPAYGRLSRVDPDTAPGQARIDSDEYEKDNPRDFAVWKAPRNEEPSWDTEIGRGRPGWHIECSAMSMDLLGETFDIHTGGVDNVFPHHENEIAQSEAATGKPFVRYWMHARFLLVEGEKMSKSQGNFFTVRDLVLKGHKPSSIRWLLSSVPYRNQLNFTFEGLKAAATSVEKLRNFRFRLTSAQLASGANPAMAQLADETAERIKSSLEDDLNAAQAQAAIFDMI